MSLRQTIWNKLAVEWRPDRVHDQVRTIDFDELPTHFDAYLKGMVRGRTVVRDRAGHASLTRIDVDAAQMAGIAARSRGSTGASSRRHDVATPNSTAARSPTATRSGASEAALIDWQTPFAPVLDYSRPPFAQMVRRRAHQSLPQRGRPASRRRAATSRRSIYISTETGRDAQLHLRASCTPR